MEVNMPSTPGTRICLYNSDELETIIRSMACATADLLRGTNKVAIVGIKRRGAPLADRLTEQLMTIYGGAPPVRLDLQVKRYADDLTLLYPDTQLTEQAQHATLDLASYTLVVVDDVLYTGHSLLTVVAYLSRKQPACIRVAVLVDRGVTRLPIRGDVVGVQLQISPADIIECHVPPYESDFKIELLKPDRSV
jgi:pyrimidine operon attenuation protein / uracil phosphoribosyltransferase